MPAAKAGQMVGTIVTVFSFNGRAGLFGAGGRHADARPDRGSGGRRHRYFEAGGAPLTFNNEGDRPARRKADDAMVEQGDDPQTSRRRKGQTGEYGSALRSVYQATVQEDIPSEFLDLLGKLD